MKKNYIQPSIKAVAMRVEGRMCAGSDGDGLMKINSCSANQGEKAWGKEDNEENGGGFGW